MLCICYTIYKKYHFLQLLYYKNKWKFHWPWIYNPWPWISDLGIH